ncbi:hypothetical protein ACQ3G6_04335 [Allorhizobium undicola]|uniref:hypothetical protein n=1 Tax=Allorhizobium undicola TaxID=78527 RepID=UPI00048831D6|nr:hypothetical protein [Allorhizobium undicola]
MTFHFARHLMATAAILAAPSFAWALDGQDLLKKINASYGGGNMTLAAGAVDVSGDNVTLRGATMTADAPDSKPVSLGDIRMSGVSANDDGSYEIEKVDFQPINFADEKTTIRADNLYLAGVSVPAKTNGNDLSSVLIYEKAHAGPITITNEGKQLLSINEGEGNTAIEDDGAALSFDAAIKGIRIDLAGLNDPKALETVEKLDLKTLTGEISMAGSWELKSGNIDITDYTVDFDRIGKLGMAVSLSGYTPELIRQIQETSKIASRAASDAQSQQQAQQAAGLAMLGLIQQLSLVSADIRFDDDGITRRALDYSGSQQGVSGKDMAQMIKAMAPMMLAQAKLGDFQKPLMEAINAYLDNPKSFAVSAEPENPVPFPMIAGAAMGAPETLPKVLGLTASANETE